MTDDPDIIKKLKEEEKLGKLLGKTENAHENLETPGNSSKEAPDGTGGFSKH